MAQLHQVFPDEGSAREQLSGLIEQVRAQTLIDIYTMAEVVGVSGYVGDFQVTIRQLARGIGEDFGRLEEVIAACPVRVPDEFNYGLTDRPAILQPYAGAYPDTAAIDWQHCNRCGECLNFNGHGGINLDNKAEEFEVNVGAVVMATGFRPYEPFEGRVRLRRFSGSDHTAAVGKIAGRGWTDGW